MTLRVLVVEDEWLARNYLVELLQLSGLAEVVAAVSTLAEARQALEPDAGAAIDVAFVDVQLTYRGDESGLDWVRAQAGDPAAPQFVLATAHKQHAAEAYELGVSDYLVKPFTQRRVTECLQRLLSRASAPGRGASGLPLRIAARSKRVIVFLDLDDVWACEAADRLTYVHSARGRFDLDLTLSTIARSFGRTLVRVHRNWLINAARVIELERHGGEMTLFLGTANGGEKNGVSVPVAKERAAGVREMLLAGARGVRR